MIKLIFIMTLVCLLATAGLTGTSAQALPPAVAAALKQAGLPENAVAVLVQDADGIHPARLSHRADTLMNPASVMKLVTTYAALDLLGPAFVWKTPVWADGTVIGDTLKGNLVLMGRGDPSLVLERLWLLLRRVQGLGIRNIDGDIVLDRRAFAVPQTDPADFDDAPLRPYNVASDALLINFKSVLLTFVPDLQANVARVLSDPPLWGVKVTPQVPLNMAASACGDYRTALKANFSDPLHIRLNGSYPAVCGEQIWPVAYVDPASYNARAIAGLWHTMGGGLTGQVRDGTAPPTSPSFVVSSPPLSSVIRDINKFSNNVMAQQVFLTLGLEASASHTGSPDAARAVLRQWWQTRISPHHASGLVSDPALDDTPVFDNGSGLSRTGRISPRALGRLLQAAYAQPLMPELMASLPMVGVDGTLKRSPTVAGSAHLKTGSLQDVMAVAGYVHAASGKRYAVAAIVNHPRAAQARPALDALLAWTLQQ